MKNPKNKLVKAYHKACTDIAEKFWDTYYAGDYECYYKEDENASFYPVGGVPSDVWEVEAHQWWTVDDMATSLEYKATKEQLEEWYWATIGEFDEEKKKHQNLKIFLKHSWVTPKVSKAEKYRLKENVENAKSDLEKAINSNK